MRKLLLSSLVLCVALSAFAQWGNWKRQTTWGTTQKHKTASATVTHTDYTKEDSCAAAYLMNGASSSVEFDVTGNGNTLFPTSTTVYNYRTDTIPSNFSGYSRRLHALRLEKQADGGTTDISGEDAQLSIVAWVRLNQEPVNGTTLKTIVSKYHNTGDQRSYMLASVGNASGGGFKFRGYANALGSSAANVTVNTTDSAYTDSTWYHVAFVDNDVDLRLYVNGVLACTPVAHTAGLFNSTALFSVGKYASSTSPDSGYFDEIGIFSKALSVAEIQEIYQFGLDGTRGANDYPLNYTEFYATDGWWHSGATRYTATMDTLADLIADNPTWTLDTLGQSIEERNIVALVIAPDGYDTTIAVTGSVHGDESAGAMAIIGFARYLQAHPDSFQTIRWIFVPICNPDGTVANTRRNAATPYPVNINRNFSLGWSLKDPEGEDYLDYGGAAAFTEIETRILRDSLILKYTPTVLVDIHAFLNNGYAISSDSIQYAIASNTFMLSNGFEPFSGAWSAAFGMFFPFADSCGVESYLYEMKKDSTQYDEGVGKINYADEINRCIAYLINFATRKQ